MFSTLLLVVLVNGIFSVHYNLSCNLVPGCGCVRRLTRPSVHLLCTRAVSPVLAKGCRDARSPGPRRTRGWESDAPPQPYSRDRERDRHRYRHTDTFHDGDRDEDEDKQRRERERKRERERERGRGRDSKRYLDRLSRRLHSAVYGPKWAGARLSGVSLIIRPGAPPGRVLAVGISPLRRREWSPAPAADPCAVPRFTVFSASCIFPALWLKMGQHGPT